MKSELIATYWEGFVATRGCKELPVQVYDAASFGDSPAMADALGQLIAAGRKTATCSALWEYEAEDKPLPEAGNRTIVLDGRGVPMCIIETSSVEIRPFCDVDAEFAWQEGEGDRSLEAWRRDHWEFFVRVLRVIGRAPTSDMPLVCERFRVIYAG